ncbi:MAG: acyltransferase family protein [Planctomycetes bacterium]|nr:acyltransferase family protein [Planctomycetota bacterium]
MLLGIFLHACLAYFPFPWIVQDAEATESIGWVFWGVHGFRMQLFLLLSGFFLAWSLHARGIFNVVVQRIKRIALPLLIGAFTIIPLVNFSIGWTMEAVNPGSQGADIWALAKRGDSAGVEAMIEEVEPTGSDAVFQLVNGLDAMRIAPLHWASFHGHIEVMEALLDSGADVNIRDNDQATPLIWASFFGQPTAVRLLLDRGADLYLMNSDGETAAGTVAGPWSEEVAAVTAWIAGFLGQKVDLNQIARSRSEVRGLLGASLPEGVEDEEVMHKKDPWDFHHLWFLWFLCILTAAFACLSILIHSLDRLFGTSIAALLSQALANPIGLILVAGLTVLAQLPMHDWGREPMFGPATSTSLFPPVMELVYYGVFFLFGFIAYQWRGKEFSVPKYWVAAIPIALLVLLPIGLYVTFDRTAAKDFGEEALRPLSVAMQSIYPWFMIFGFFGLFRLCMSGGSRVVRYLSDASYWMYLIHLPVVFALQGAFHSLEWGAWPKFLAVSAIGFTLSLLSYTLLIRHTKIGWILHGRQPSWARSDA